MESLQQNSSSLTAGTILRKGLGLGLLFLCISIPFEWYVFPSTGLLLESVIAPFLERLGTWLLPACSDCIWAPISDSHGLYLLSFICLSLGISTSVLLKLYWSSWRKFPFSYVEVILLLYLAVQVGGYGVQKLLMQQFFPPEANTLFTPLGQLEKDILFWSTMGVSRFYNLFLGSMEIIPVLMLLHYRTRTFGLALLVMVLIHILVIDISYDIDVKLYAGFLLSIAVFLLWPGIKMIHEESNQASLTIRTERMFSQKPVFARLRTLVILLVMAEMLSPVVAHIRTAKIQFISEELVGAYELVGEHNDRIQKVFFHSKGYMITMDKTGRFTDHRVMSSPDGKELVLLDDSRLLQMHRDSTTGTLMVKGKLENSTIKWQLQKLDVNELPLINDRIEWMVRRSPLKES